jgi:hypothetical protein
MARMATVRAVLTLAVMRNHNVFHYIQITTQAKTTSFHASDTLQLAQFDCFWGTTPYMDDLCDTVNCNFPSSLILIIYTPHHLHSLPFLLSSAFLGHTSSRCACGPLRSLVTTDVMNKGTAMSQGKKLVWREGKAPPVRLPWAAKPESLMTRAAIDRMPNTVRP